MSQLNPDLPPYWFVSTPRQAGKSLYHRMVEDYEARLRDSKSVREYSFGIDPAKPGSDRTVVSIVNPGSGYFCAIKDDLANPAGRATPADLAAPCAPVQPDTEHIWDMIVLAAESSRYG